MYSRLFSSQGAVVDFLPPEQGHLGLEMNVFSIGKGAQAKLAAWIFFFFLYKTLYLAETLLISQTITELSETPAPPSHSPAPSSSVPVHLFMPPPPLTPPSRLPLPTQHARLKCKPRASNNSPENTCDKSPNTASFRLPSCDSPLCICCIWPSSGCALQGGGRLGDVRRMHWVHGCRGRALDGGFWVSCMRGMRWRGGRGGPRWWLLGRNAFVGVFG